MHKSQEPKYVTTADGKIMNRQSKEVIPDEEPIFIIRGKDKYAIAALANYLNLLRTLQTDNSETEEHCQAIEKRIADFTEFARDYPDRMKEPTTDLKED